MTKGGVGPPYAFFRLRWDFPFLVVCTVYIIRVQKIRETWRNDNQLNRCKIYWWEWDLVQYAPIESLVWTFWTLFVCVCVCVCVKSMKQQGTWLANGSWFIGKTWTFCPKDLYSISLPTVLFDWQPINSGGATWWPNFFKKMIFFLKIS